MDVLRFNKVYRVPVVHGPKVRIRVQTYADGDACFIAAPSQGEIDEPPAMNAIAALEAYLTASGEAIRVTQREYRFAADHGRDVVRVADTVIVPGGASRVRELLLIIHRTTTVPVTS